MEHYPVQHSTARIERLRGYLGHAARISISDGRIFMGKFVLTDKDRNVILANAREERNGSSRLVGLVMIPGKHLTKFEIEDLEAKDLYA